MTHNGNFKIPVIKNEPMLNYKQGSVERAKLQQALDDLMQKAPVKVPLVIDGKEIFKISSAKQHMPHSHRTVLAEYAEASADDVQSAIVGSLKAKEQWEQLPWTARAAVFLKAAHLLSTEYKYELMAATMLGQGKNCWQAEIDAGAELMDFFRFNVKYAEQLYNTQPPENAPGIWNQSEYRALEGFVYAVAPFNFTAIAGNLAGAPALMGNVVLFKPSPYAVLSNYIVHRAMSEAGVPPGVIQFIPGDADTVTKVALGSQDFAALHYTGSTQVLKLLWKQITDNFIKPNGYKSYPRIVGETGGKNFHLVTANANVAHAALSSVRAAFEFQGQKCSALSRVYVSESVWPEFMEKLVSETKALQVGSPMDFKNFVTPVIHATSFDKLSLLLKQASKDPQIEILCGGTCDDSEGYFVQPTLLKCTDVDHDIFSTEFFGPVVAIYVYKDKDLDLICEKINTTSIYALTGAVFSQDRSELERLSQRLRNAAGNFYLNDKCTGAVVGEQPFGGARASGTNDKAGSASILSRFVSPRSIKENFGILSNVLYPSNQ